MPDTLTIAEFVRTRGIVIETEQIDDRPDRHKDDEQWGDSHWKCRLRYNGKDQRRSMLVYYSMGSALTDPPTVEDVLNSLVSDSNALDQSFEYWCSEFGMDTDSRRAERTYNQCRKLSKHLKTFLGGEDFKVLTEQCERL